MGLQIIEDCMFGAEVMHIYIDIYISQYVNSMETEACEAVPALQSADGPETSESRSLALQEVCGPPQEEEAARPSSTE